MAKNQPLNLPMGSVRAIICGFVIFASVVLEFYCTVAGKQAGGNLYSMASLAFGYYVGNRTNQKVEEVKDGNS